MSSVTQSYWQRLAQVWNDAQCLQVTKLKLHWGIINVCSPNLPWTPVYRLKTPSNGPYLATSSLSPLVRSVIFDSCLNSPAVGEANGTGDASSARPPPLTAMAFRN